MSNPSRREFRCNICGKISTREFNHREHERTHYPPTKQCPYCPKIFKSSSSLTGHIARHSQAGSRVNRLAQSPEANQPYESRTEGSKLIWMRPVRLEHAGGAAQVFSESASRSNERNAQSTSGSLAGPGPSAMNQRIAQEQRAREMRQTPPRHLSGRHQDSRNLLPPLAIQSNTQATRQRSRTNDNAGSDPEVSPLPEDWSDSDVDTGSGVSDLDERR